MVAANVAAYDTASEELGFGVGDGVVGGVVVDDGVDLLDSLVDLALQSLVLWRFHFL